MTSRWVDNHIYPLLDERAEYSVTISVSVSFRLPADRETGGALSPFASLARSERVLTVSPDWTGEFALPDGYLFLKTAHQNSCKMANGCDFKPNRRITRRKYPSRSAP
jgi:hypothetical protein